MSVPKMTLLGMSFAAQLRDECSDPCEALTVLALAAWLVHRQAQGYDGQKPEDETFPETFAHTLRGLATADVSSALQLMRNERSKR